MPDCTLAADRGPTLSASQRYPLRHGGGRRSIRQSGSKPGKKGGNTSADTDDHGKPTRDAKRRGRLRKTRRIGWCCHRVGWRGNPGGRRKVGDTGLERPQKTRRILAKRTKAAQIAAHFTAILAGNHHQPRLTPRLRTWSCRRPQQRPPTPTWRRYSRRGRRCLGRSRRGFWRWWERPGHDAACMGWAAGSSTAPTSTPDAPAFCRPGATLFNEK